jgi:superfamily II helicase
MHRHRSGTISLHGSPLPPAPAAPSHYHASLTPEERERVQAAWSRDELQVIVATIAFGMGECVLPALWS